MNIPIYYATILVMGDIPEDAVIEAQCEDTNGQFVKQILKWNRETNIVKIKSQPILKLEVKIYEIVVIVWENKEKKKRN